MPESLRTYNEALAYAQAEHENETEDWEGYCQRFVRSCYGIPSLFSSAWAQWLGADDEDKHVSAFPAEAPLGAALCFKGSGPFGHIMLAARNDGAWSNDLVRTGDIDWVQRIRPTVQWGQGYLGYLTAVNDYDLQLREAKPPKPKLKRYASVQKAIDRMDRAIETAQAQKEWRDAKALRAERRHLVELYDLLRHK